MYDIPLATDEVLLALEDVIEDPNNTNGLLLVPFLGRGHVNGMEEVKPSGLAIVGALFTRSAEGNLHGEWCEYSHLAGHLKVQILLQLPFLGCGGKSELFLLIIGFDDVLNDGAGLPEGKPGVGVFDGGQAAVGVDFGVGLSLGVLDGNLWSACVRSILCSTA